MDNKKENYTFKDPKLATVYTENMFTYDMDNLNRTNKERDLLLSHKPWNFSESKKGYCGKTTGRNV